IGELPMSEQSKLLRVLDSKEIRRVGGSQTIRTDVRVVAATHVCLADAVDRGAFREDLYYRLSVVYVKVPPLRNRKEDIPKLAKNFLERIRGPGSTLSHDLLAVLMSHSWPGNVRELRNVVDRWATFGCARPEVLLRGWTPPQANGTAEIGQLARLPYHE